MLVPRYAAVVRSSELDPKEHWPCTGTGPKEKYLASSSKARIPGRPAKALADFRIFDGAQKVESYGMKR